MGLPIMDLTTTSPYHIVDSEVHLSTPTTTNVGENVSPIIQKWNNQKKKGEYEEGGGKGWELTLCLSIDI